MNKQRRRGRLLAAMTAGILFPVRLWTDAPISAPSTPALAAAHPEQPPTVAKAEASYAWPGRAMAMLRGGVSAEALARDLNAVVLRAAGPSGLVTFQARDANDRGQLLAALRADPRVSRAMPSGRVRGAGVTSVQALQWHMAAADADGTLPSAEGVTVAILDTGVAHGEGCDAVSGLTDVPVVSALDLVNEGSAACDDHQHGTHIASIIASRGALGGVAPDVTLMPVKVLDEANEGDEQALIDGILWAVEQGADVINLSLSFEPDYVPSPDLLIALRAAHDADVIMVAASGNNGGETVTWPAASPLVIAVGGATLDEDGGLTPVTYGDLGPEVDLLAPGGALDLDRNRDGYGDGILAETINLGDPEESGYWFYEGTSQAAAQVSGAVAVLLAAGVAPEDVLPTLQASASDVGERAWLDGVGAGAMNLGAALKLVEAGEIPVGRQLHAAILPYLLVDPGGTKLAPLARVAVLDEEGSPVAGVKVYGRADSSAAARTWRCTTDSQGLCKVEVPLVSATAADGGALSRAWRFTVDAVALGDGSAASPTSFLVLTDSLEALSTGLVEAGVGTSTLAFHWNGEDDARLGPLASGLSLLDAGRGGATAPSALMLTERLADEIFSFETLTLDMSGAGVATDSLGVTVERSSTGSGVATDSLGATDTKGTTRVSGSGVATDSLGITALSLVGQEAGESHGLSTGDQPVFPGEASAALALEGTRAEEALSLSGAPEEVSVVQSLAASEELSLTGEAAEPEYMMSESLD